jgi:hypothetical protein
MTESFLLYLKLGWEHIVSADAIDHQLFLLALVVPFSFRDRRNLFILITSFTIGHCITLALSAQKLISFSSYWIELLIPVTILVTALFQGIRSVRNLPQQEINSLYGMAGFFGLIHGLGFANTLKSLLGREESLLVPLSGFNLGIEAGQIAVLCLLLIPGTAIRYFLPAFARYWMIGVSLLAIAGSTHMIWERI